MKRSKLPHGVAEKGPSDEFYEFANRRRDEAEAELTARLDQLNPILDKLRSYISGFTEQKPTKALSQSFDAVEA